MINWIPATKENLIKYGIIKDLECPYASYEQSYWQPLGRICSYVFLVEKDKSAITCGFFCFRKETNILAYYDSYLIEYGDKDNKEHLEQKVTHFCLFEEYEKMLPTN